MINSKMYRLKEEYKSDLVSRLEQDYICEKCLKKDVVFKITQDKRLWDVTAECSSCGQKELYNENPRFRGFIIGQYKDVLRKKFPDIKIKFFKEKIKKESPPQKIQKVAPQDTPKKFMVEKATGRIKLVNKEKQ